MTCHLKKLETLQKFNPKFILHLLKRYNCWKPFSKCQKLSVYKLKEQKFGLLSFKNQLLFGGAATKLIKKNEVHSIWHHFSTIINQLNSYSKMENNTKLITESDAQYMHMS